MDREKCLESVVRHDILNVLTAILGMAEILIKDFKTKENEKSLNDILSTALEMKNILKAGKTGKEVQGQLHVLIGTSQVLLGTMEGNEWVSKISNLSEKIKCITDMARACSKTLTLKSFILSEVVEREGRFLGLEISTGRNNLSFRADCMFTRVIGNLFQNAVRHGQATAISIGIKREGDDIMIIFEDNGKGIPEKNKKRIFEYGFTTKVGEPGGEGLAYCMDILALSGASIAETGIPGKGARFEILILKEDIISIS